MSKIWLGQLLFFFSLIVGSQSAMAGRPVWVAHKEWTDQTENEFADWIQKNATSDFFTKKEGVFGGQLEVDCARATYAMRLAFAAEKGLQFVARGNSGRFYDSSNDDAQTFIEFARKVISDLSTVSVQYNSFPVAVTKSAVKPGVVFLFQMPNSPGDAGRHAYMLRDITAAGVPHFIWATVPQKARELTERLQFPVYMPLAPSWNNQWGFRRFYQPRDYPIRESLNRIQSQINQLKMRRRTVAEDQQLETLTRTVDSVFKQMFGSRGYNEDDQRKIAESVVSKYEKDVRAYLRQNNLDDSKLDFSNLNFRSALLGRNPQDLKKIPALPEVSAEKQFVANGKSKDKDAPTISLIMNYQNIIADRLQTGLPERLNHTLQREFWNLCFYIRERKYAVEEGYEYFFKGFNPIVSAPNTFRRCIAKGGQEEYNYSTPNRDSDMEAFIKGVKGYYERNRETIRKNFPAWFYRYEVIYADKPVLNSDPVENEKLIAQVKEEILSLPVSLEQRQTCNYSVQSYDGKPGENLTPWLVRQRLEVPGLLSPKPWVSIERRWGQRAPRPGELSVEENPHCDTQQVIKADRAL